MSSPADRPQHPSRLRVGDQEREQAAAALGEHYAHGRLSHGEHADRLDAAWSARTRADLDLLFHDLPVAGFRPTPPPAGVARGGRSGRPARSGPNPWLLVLAIVAAVVVLSQVRLLLLLLLVVAFVAVKRHRRRDRQVAGPPLWH
ncbi:DUF1707 SHOCT-like domain-containing protein [Nocardioides sp. AX2bis]|uniref:DUF1707 SHOCT-like domain-containing protein n=1 Tax=Nocardioides sp. AX2bis TaxID=2653157 RepID=UPI0012F029D3|nr:DUF1707 domain-containing protein [Nocardioides sp. AX2bis]VXB27683.1 conserved hypothetical protein [Nocardioides sp. AX2bis]